MRHFREEILRAHPSWHAILEEGLRAIERDWRDYLSALLRSEFLPIRGCLFAAFSQPIDHVKYVLVGEGPYPRLESANGYCFMDAAVTSLWSSEVGGGLSKPVNRATSLRNFIKMLLVAESHIALEELNPDSIADFVTTARKNTSGFIQTMSELQTNFLQSGFLLLNASLVFRKDVAPVKDARAWFSFMSVVVSRLEEYHRCHPSLDRVCFILWGKIADQCLKLPSLQGLEVFDIAQAEHPYNLSFIYNQAMWQLFAPLRLLRARAA